MSNAPQPSDSGIVVTSEFIRHRNVLLTRGTMTDLFMEYYLHLADSGLQVAPDHDRLFKDLLTVTALHAASRPRGEYLAWTMNLQEPLLNLFVTADNESGTLAGRVFTENVRHGSSNLLYLETVVRRGAATRRSVIDFTGADILAAAEAFIAKSEQRPGRFLALGDEEYALLSAHPDCDLPWLEQVTPDNLRETLAGETEVPMERRRYTWGCGCSERRMFQILAPTMQQDPQSLFDGENSLRIECPRCGRPYRITREALEAYVARKD